MALAHLLYRCPLCGHDPTTGRGDRARCAGCGARFARERGRVRVHDATGGVRLTTPGELLDRIQAVGGALGAAERPDGSVRYEAAATFHGFVAEEPLRHGGRILGYRERPASGAPGTLSAGRHGIRFTPAEAPSGGREGERWELDHVVALQVASRSLQVRVRGRGTAQLTLVSDSTLRWEELIQALLRERWRAGGRGEIVEFQPRIVAR